MTTQPPAPDWYPDPSGKPGLMYWDGQQWHESIPATGSPTEQPPAPPISSTQQPWRQTALIAALVVSLTVLFGIVGVTSYVLLKRSHPSHTSTAQPTAPSSHPTAQPAPSSSGVPSSAGIPGLAPFVGTWQKHEERLVIDSIGTGVDTYPDLKQCPSCSFADAPTGTLTFTFTSVSNGRASGSVTATSDAQTHAVGESVTAMLTAGSPGRLLQVTIGGVQQIPFCDSIAEAAHECGA